MPCMGELPAMLFFTPLPKVNFKKLFILLGVICVVGCATVAVKDPISLQNAIELKVESLAFLDNAIDPPRAHITEILELRLKLLKALEYEKTRGELNSISIQQWEILIDPKGHLLGGFLQKWESGSVGRSPAFINGVKNTVAQAFDHIIKLESHKQFEP